MYIKIFLIKFHMFLKLTEYLEYYKYLQNLILIIIYLTNKKVNYIIILIDIIKENKCATLYFQNLLII